jgi:phosphomethylpyrimidine synthase
MRITQDIRDYAAKRGVEDDAAIVDGMTEKAEEFRKRGSEIYLAPVGGK